MNIVYILVTIFLLCQCRFSDKKTIREEIPSEVFTIYTDTSALENEYIGFNSPKAINRIAEIENEYFNNYPTSFSKYYGTIWYKFARNDFSHNDSVSLFDLYLKEISDRNETPDSMHCTIYAMEALKAGLQDDFINLDAKHKEIWKNREYAGWSIAYILTTFYNWEAYLIISEHSDEYQACIRNFRKNRLYNVWQQPDIPITQMFLFENDKQKIDSLLKLHEFGWGFSDQGFHTWITRFNTLKECNQEGLPAEKYARGYEKPLFLKTKFTEFTDYSSHVIVFPRKKDQ